MALLNSFSMKLLISVCLSDCCGLSWSLTSSYNPDPSLQYMVERILPICNRAAACRTFVDIHSRYEYGLVHHALSASIRDLLDVFKSPNVHLHPYIYLSHCFVLAIDGSRCPTRARAEGRWTESPTSLVLSPGVIGIVGSDIQPHCTGERGHWWCTPTTCLSNMGRGRVCVDMCMHGVCHNIEL